MNLKKLVLENNSFRKVIDTGLNTQLVIMSIKPNDDIPKETHMNVDQFIYIVDGTANIIINNKTHKLSNDDAIIIKAGETHQVINAEKRLLKLYTLYSPPEHAKYLEQIEKQTGGTIKIKINYEI